MGDSFFKRLSSFCKDSLHEKCPNMGSFFDPYFPAFRINTMIYSINLRIQFEYRKIRIRINSIFEHFSRSDCNCWYDFLLTVELVHADSKKGQGGRQFDPTLTPFLCFLQKCIF